MDRLTGLHIACKMLENVEPLNVYRVVILSIFLTLFYITPYVDSVLSAFIIRQWFNNDLMVEKRIIKELTDKNYVSRYTMNKE